MPIASWFWRFSIGVSDCADGANPYSGLIQASDGNLYGTTGNGGAYGQGSIFKITPTGTFTTLYSFCAVSGCPDGAQPQDALVQDTSGILYGVTTDGGTGDVGAIFSFSMGLGPFIKVQPAFGKIGSPVEILGTNLTGATSVTFNGVAATFRVAASTLITATVPAGATNGRVQVVTPGGTLSSNVSFHVLP